MQFLTLAVVLDGVALPIAFIETLKCELLHIFEVSPHLRPRPTLNVDEL